jgi:hypothetical protein
MVMQTQSEMKTLIHNQLTFCSLQTITSLLIGIGLTIATPLNYSGKENKAKLMNGLSFFGAVVSYSYAYVSSNQMTTLSGKLKMFEQLEKERFIQEQVLSQQFYLEQANQYYQPPIIEPQFEPVMPSQNMAVTQCDSHIALTDDNVINDEIPICHHCGSHNVIKNGFTNGIQRYKCKDCNKTS